MMTSIRKADRTTVVAMLLPSILFLACMTVVPMFFILYASFSDWNLMRSPTPSLKGVGNYVRLFFDPYFWQSLGVSLCFTIICLVAETVLGVLIALLINRNFKFRGIARSIILIPMMLTPAVIAMIWRVLLNPQFGIINYMLQSLGLDGPLWLADPTLALISLCVVDIWEWTPFMALSALAALQSVPNEVIESGYIDGASDSVIFWNIILPLIRPVVFISASFRLGALLRWFDTFYVMTAGGPGRSTENLPMYIYKSGFFYYDMGYSSALAFVLLVLTVVVSLGFVKSSQIDR
ncbi:MAG: sugar ABC transporter permease [Spirochaetes bacterium]|nr:sugar ABC transporter permease [Spirochaetota bacterium]